MVFFTNVALGHADGEKREKRNRKRKRHESRWAEFSRKYNPTDRRGLP